MLKYSTCWSVAYQEVFVWYTTIKMCVYLYSELCLNLISLGPAFMLGIDRFSAYAGKINKDFVHWDFI
jgi:hypothetical protein